MLTSLIILSTEQSIVALALCLLIIGRGRPQYGLGIYLSLMAWDRIIVIFGMSHTWVLLGTLVAASMVFVLKNRSMPSLPLYDRWIVPWMGLWVAWMLLLILLFRPSNELGILHSLLRICLAPLPFVSLFVRTADDMKALAYSFVLSKIMGELLYFFHWQIPLSSILADPSQGGWGAQKWGVYNYHWWGIGYAISMILAFALLSTERRRLLRLLVTLLLFFSAWFLMLSRSKQSMLGAMAVMALFVIWSTFRRGVPSRLRALFVLAVLVVGAAWLYTLSPDLLVRAYDTPNKVAFLDAMRPEVAVRTGLWGAGWHVFLSSPIWGVGFGQTVLAHNFLIGTFADQGIVGFVFLIGLFAFAARQVRGILLDRDHDDRAVWRMAWLCIILFAAIRGQASGAVYSLWDIFWACAVLWGSRLPVQARCGEALPTHSVDQAIPQRYRRKLWTGGHQAAYLLGNHSPIPAGAGGRIRHERAYNRVAGRDKGDVPAELG